MSLLTKTNMPAASLLRTLSAYTAPAQGTYCPDLGTFTGHPGDPRTPDGDEAEEYAQALDEAASEFEAAAAHIRRGNEIAADKLIASALLVLGGKWQKVAA